MTTWTDDADERAEYIPADIRPIWLLLFAVVFCVGLVAALVIGQHQRCDRLTEQGSPRAVQVCGTDSAP